MERGVEIVEEASGEGGEDHAAVDIATTLLDGEEHVINVPSHFGGDDDGGDAMIACVKVEMGANVVIHELKVRARPEGEPMAGGISDAKGVAGGAKEDVELHLETAFFAAMDGTRLMPEVGGKEDSAIAPGAAAIGDILDDGLAALFCILKAEEGDIRHHTGQDVALKVLVGAEEHAWVIAEPLDAMSRGKAVEKSGLGAEPWKEATHDYTSREGDDFFPTFVMFMGEALVSGDPILRKSPIVDDRLAPFCLLRTVSGKGEPVLLWKEGCLLMEKRRSRIHLCRA